VFTNANVIDGISAQPMRLATVTVRGGLIVDIAAASQTPQGATVIDLKGKWLLPGLIDAHVHINNLDRARVALESGVTTLRTGRGGLDVREQHRAGVVTVPDVVASGLAVSRPPVGLFQAFPSLADMKGRFRGPEDMRRVVRTLAESGVDVIKILATERAGVADADPRQRTFTDEELVAVVEAATLAGRAVMAHAHGDEGAAGAVRAGARSIEHGTYMSDATLALMKARGTFYVPTFTVVEWYTAGGGQGADPIVRERSRLMMPDLRTVATKAVKLGVRIVAGTDTTYEDKFRMHDELTALVRAGLSPMAALKSATSVAAECLTIEKRTGAIKPGLEADLIVVQDDPTGNVEALREVLLVLNNGKIAVNRLR
jgi:imidazolonepropionase-like amidohydrolase